MWTTVVAAASLMSLAAAEGKDLKIAHARFTHGGITGVERTSTDFLAPDIIWLVFDVENLTRSPRTGKFVYSVTLDCLNSRGRRIFGHDDPHIEDLDALGGTTLATFAWVNIGRDTAPGKYSLRLTVNDKVGRKKAQWKRDFTIRNKGFGFSRVSVLSVGFAGQPARVLFFVQGFEKNARNMPSVKVTIHITDRSGKETLRDPITLSIPRDLGKEVDPRNLLEVGPLETSFRLSRPGKFTILLEAEDRVAKKRVKLPCNITVLDPRQYESSR
jgi:hypothetical protein